jgi:hypothetical protein
VRLLPTSAERGIPSLARERRRRDSSSRGRGPLALARGRHAAALPRRCALRGGRHRRHPPPSTQGHGAHGALPSRHWAKGGRRRRRQLPICCRAEANAEEAVLMQMLWRCSPPCASAVPALGDLDGCTSASPYARASASFTSARV